MKLEAPSALRRGSSHSPAMFPLVSLCGDPLSRGHQYGSQAATLIRHSIASYAELFAYRQGWDWNRSQAEALAYLPFLEKHTPTLLEEMQGIATASKRTLAEILALNLRTELLAGSAQIGSNDADEGECTTVAAISPATLANKTLLAQTWDWYGHQRQACLLLRIQAPGQPDILTLTEAGILAKIGLNSAGIGVSLNLLRSRTDGQMPGMPIHLLLRLLLEASTLDEAISIVKSLPASASSCITIADGSAGQVLSLEITPTGIGWVEPQQGCLAHTNHCLVDSTMAGELPLEGGATTRQRYDRAKQWLDGQAQITSDSLKSLLRDHQGEPTCICRHPNPSLPPLQQSESVMGVVMDVSAGVMNVAPGIPCQVDFEAIPLCL